MDSNGITSLIFTVVLKNSMSKQYGLQLASGPYFPPNSQSNVLYSMNTYTEEFRQQNTKETVTSPFKNEQLVCFRLEVFSLKYLNNSVTLGKVIWKPPRENSQKLKKKKKGVSVAHADAAQHAAIHNGQ